MNPNISESFWNLSQRLPEWVLGRIGTVLVPFWSRLWAILNRLGRVLWRLVAVLGRLVAVLASQMPPNGKPKTLLFFCFLNTFAFRSHGDGSVLGSRSVGKILRKSFRNSQKILPKTTPNPTKILSKRGFSTESKKSSLFFFSLRLLGASWAVWVASWGRLGSSWGRPWGRPWGVLWRLWSVLARLGGVLAHLGRVLGRLCGAARFFNRFVIEI